VPPQRIAEGASDLQALLGEHGFLPGVAGHASAGNLHFMLTPDFSKPSELDRYQAFMADLVELIVGKYDGSLKAEHGTGFNMAPYVEREWGPTATEMMWQIKRLADPDGVLSPGVVLNRDPGVHLRNLKTSPPIEESVSACVECGFCEPVCPSRNLTTTPRQRIVLRREMARQGGGSALARVLLEEFTYQALDTCATDGSCQLACPVGIDTGELVRELRGARHTERAEAAALFASRRWRGIEAAARTALRLGAPAARRSRRGRALPGPAPGQLPSTSPSAAAAIYLPSCTNRILGRAEATSPATSLVAAMVEVSRRTGLPVWIPAEVPGSCCGLPWSSKGFRRAHAHKANEMVENLWRWSAEGALPVLSDAASCTQAIADPGEGVLSEENSERLARIEILDSLAWVHDRLLPELRIPQKLATATVHPSCATRRMGLRAQFESIAASLAEDVVIAPTATCCGFAGDRGITHPELTESATREQAAELSGERFEAHLCNNRTCELGLQRATEEPYESFVFALERLTRAG
jgi:D-lactate dehydrogenase